MSFTHETIEKVLFITFKENLIVTNIDAKLIQVIDEHIENGILACAIDLSKIDYMNSTGIGILTRILAKFRNKDGEVVLIQPSESIRKLLIITKLNAIFTIVKDKQEAIKVLNQN